MTRFHEIERSIHIDQGKVEKEEVKEMIGTSPVMMEIFSTIRKVATSDLPVLIVGESGTGKELTAKAIHERSSRKDGPFIAINCGAIPEGLLESELFGYERGAFTGAYTQKKGKIEDASSGILFLDEIGELSSPLQVKLLRFLEDYRITRLGGRNEIEVDVRIIAATNADLKGAVSIGAFREDLYYRLSGITVSLLPLRERGDDAILMARAFLKKYERENNSVKIRGFTHEATEDGWITPEGMELIGLEVLSRPKTLEEHRDLIEKDIIIKTLNRYNWNISRACKELGISRPHLYTLIKKFNLSNKFTSL
jgi:two-component system NtrC family response regulator